MQLFRNLVKSLLGVTQVKYNSSCCWPMPRPQHLICFKQWTSEMVMTIIKSAINLKCSYSDTHFQRMNVLENAKIMILQEENEPVLNMAVSKAATFLGAYDVSIVDNVNWDQDYAGRFFSYMTDAIFVVTSKHQCIQRFADQSTVPVLCMRSRAHASIQALATVMCIVEEFGSMNCMNVGWVGAPHPVLNSYLLLCPMLGANIRYKCCCKDAPISPLLLKSSEELCHSSNTYSIKCTSTDEVLSDSFIFISGPSPNKDKLEVFKLSLHDIMCKCRSHWIFFHTCPRGEEVPDDLFYHPNSRVFNSFENMQFIAAALMANSVKGLVF